MTDQRDPRPRHPRPARPPKEGGGRLLAVQCIACAVVLLATLCLRLVGGDVFGQLRIYFRDSLMENTLAASLTALWDGNIPWQSASSATAVTTTTATTVTAAATTTTAATVSGTGGAAVAAASGTLPTGVSADRLTLPDTAALPLTSGTVSSRFGWRELNGKTAFHMGLDIAAGEGSPIAALYDGTVTAVGESSSYGNFIRLSHADGVEVLYAHCLRVTAKEGDTVQAGQTVAEVGSTGDSDGNHLHMEVRQNDVVYDPAALLPDGCYA